jgi:hypothetical protein
MSAGNAAPDRPASPRPPRSRDLLEQLAAASDRACAIPAVAALSRDGSQIAFISDLSGDFGGKLFTDDFMNAGVLGEEAPHRWAHCFCCADPFFRRAACAWAARRRITTQRFRELFAS